MDTMEQEMERVAEAIWEDYGKGRDIDRLTYGYLPDRKAVTELLTKLRRLVFPGFFQDSACSARCALSLLTGQTVRLLHRQITPVLCGAGDSLPEAYDRAKTLCLTFLGELPRIRALMQTDLQAAYDGDPAATCPEEILCAYPGLYAVTVYRLANALCRLGVPLLPRVMTEQAHSATGIDIHPGADIGAYFFIDHGTGTVIGQTTVIGCGVKLYQGVTLGGLSTRGGQDLRRTKRHPTLGDRVTVYANATVLGGDTVIGHDCVIGAGAFITESVPPCTTVQMQEPPLQYRPRNCPGCKDP